MNSHKSICDINMVRHIAIKDSLYEQLSELKGDRSFSYAIESLLEKCTPVEPAKTQTGVASTTA